MGVPVLALSSWRGIGLVWCKALDCDVVEMSWKYKRKGKKEIEQKKSGLTETYPTSLGVFGEPNHHGEDPHSHRRYIPSEVPGPTGHLISVSQALYHFTSYEFSIYYFIYFQPSGRRAEVCRILRNSNGVCEQA